MALVLHMPFFGNANDISGNNNHGTVWGAQLVADKYGQPNRAYDFDGLDDYIENSVVPADPAAGFSVALWVRGVRGPSANGGYAYICHRSDQRTVGTSIWFLSINNNNNYAGAVNGNSALSYGDTGIAASSETWRHLAMTYGEGGGVAVKVYVDGVHRSGSSTPITNPTTGNRLSWGSAAFDTTYRPFDGQMMDARVYDNPLTDTEVKALYEQGSYGAINFFS